MVSSALWTLQGLGEFSNDEAARALKDADPFIRSWAVQLAADDKSKLFSAVGSFPELARSDSSPIVRRYLASAAQRIPDAVA